jgi:RimJ/RimL family protein N-acetyltransferase
MLGEGVMNAVLRQAHPSDLENLLRLYAQFEPKGEFGGLPPVTLSETERWLRAVWYNGYHHFVVESGARLVGHAILHEVAGKREAELSMFVHQDFRGLGLGRRLLLGVLNHACKQLHLHRVWVRVHEANATVQEDLERAGFQTTDLNDIFKAEFEMGRALNCAECKGEQCIIFTKGLPVTVAMPKLFW